MTYQTQMILAWAAILIVYFLPWIVASIRGTKNSSWVALINVFFGWTLLGWFVALIMAAEGKKRA